MRRLALIIVALVVSVVAVPLIAQENPEEQKDWFVQFVEGQLSAPDRQISISGIDGVLSSDVTIPEITISDEEGVWLRIVNASLNWDQGALLGGTLKINSLVADKIDYVRPAVPADGVDLPDPEAQAPEIPQLPVAILLDKLDVPSVTFGEQVFGLGSEIGVEGNLKLVDGSLDTALDIIRKDGPGGTLSLALTYDRETRNADIGLDLAEPPNGLIVNLLGMEGKPDLNLSLKGSGPLTSLRTDMSLDVGGKRALSGTAQLTQAEGGLAIDASLGGPVADLVPTAYKRFFGTETQLTAKALVRDAGGIVLSELALRGGQMSLTANGSTTSDGFLDRLDLAAQIADASGAKVLLPGGGAETGLDNAQFAIQFAEGRDWTADLTIDGLETADLSADRFELALSGAASDLADPQKRRVTFNGDGSLTGLTSPDPQIAEALGDAMGLGIAGLWQPDTGLQLAQLRLSGSAFDMVLAGVMKGLGFTGKLSLTTPSIASFSGLAGRQLGGGIDVSAEGTIDALSGGFDLSLKGEANDLTLGEAVLDKLLAGKTGLAGRIARDATGFSADNFEIGNSRSRITANGQFSSKTADFAFGVALADLALVSENASGALTANGTARGTDGKIALNFDLSVPTGTLSDHRLTEARLSLGGMLADAALSGNLSGTAFLDGHRVQLVAGLQSAEDSNRLSGLKFTIQGTELTGDVSQDSNGLVTGKLDLNSTDLTLAAALMLADAQGAATASISLMPVDGKQNASVAADVSDLVANGEIRIGSATIRAEIVDLFGVPAIDGTIDGTKLTLAGITAETISATASQGDDTTHFTANAALDNGANLAASGSFGPAGSGYRLVLNEAQLDHGSLTAKLIGATSATIAGDSVILEQAVLDVGGGRVTSTGTAGATLDLRLDLKDVPLAIANAIQPELGLSGTLGGRVHVTGTSADPEIGFDLSGAGIGASAIAEFGVAPLSIAASGSFASETLSLAALSAKGSAGTVVNANGTLPLVGTGGDLVVKGSIPLSLANRMLASRGAQASGTLALDARLTGSLAKPAYGGTISTTGAEIVDPLSNLRLRSIAATARLDGDNATIERLTGTLASGGTISVSGTVSLDADAGMPADLAIALNSARYADGTMVVATASGQLALRGALTRGPELSGTVSLERAEISIPDSFGADTSLLNVTHEAAPSSVLATLRRIAANAPETAGSGRSSSLSLNIGVDAPNQVFVRGRGLDAELGGRVRLTGPVDAVQPVGGFSLIRGRLTILGQRIDLDSGSVSLIGDLNPYIDLSASSPGDGITVYVTVRGPANDLAITFTSSPELPQDEVLAQLIFKRTLGDLSPLQLAKLAAAASELAGGGGDSLTESLRSAAGLADLDVVTDAEGNTAVRAGTYVQDNIYLGVEAGTQGSSKVTIDLDLTDTIKATGSTTSDGNSSIGLFYEQDF